MPQVLITRIAIYFVAIPLLCVCSIPRAIASTSAGLGQESGAASSTTQAAISGIAGNKAARTGDKETGIQKIFDATAVKDEINAQVAITSEFGKQVSKAVGDYAQTQYDKAVAANDAAAIAQWKEGGTARVALHALVGGLNGGVGGAAGAATSQTLVPTLGEELAKLDMPAELKNTLLQVASLAIGAVSGDASGAVAAQNATANNYLKHAEAMRLGTLLSKKTLGQCDSTCERDIKYLQALDKMRNANLASCDGVASIPCDANRQEVRTSAAEYIRRNDTAGTLDLANTYAQEKSETLSLAGGTVDGKAAGAVEGVVGSFVDGAMALGKLVVNVTGSIFGDAQSQAQLREAAGAAYELLKDPNNWPLLLGAMNASDREKLAQAYEQGDGRTIGQLMGAQLVNLPMGSGAALGTIKKIDKGVLAAEDIAKAGSKLPSSGVDIAHTIGADYNPRTGKVTGGHSLLNNDVRVTEVISPPDVHGVYEATVSIKTPDGQWIPKTSNGGKNTMFPKDWDATKIQVEIDSAWNSSTKTIDPKTGQWTAKSDSGVVIQGYIQPRPTAYPLYNQGK